MPPRLLSLSPTAQHSVIDTAVWDGRLSFRGDIWRHCGLLINTGYVVETHSSLPTHLSPNPLRSQLRSKYGILRWLNWILPQIEVLCRSQVRILSLMKTLHVGTS